MSKKQVIDKDYYVFQAALPRIEKGLKIIQGNFNKFGLKIPKTGFKTSKEFEDFIEILHKKYSQVIVSKNYREKRKNLIKGKTKFSYKEYVKLEQFEFDNLPLINFGSYYNKILQEIGINQKNRYFKGALNNLLFYRKSELIKPRIRIRLIRNNKAGELELYLRIYPYTTKEDINNPIIWKLIQDTKKYLKDYRGKFKDWNNFDRDLKIYLLYKKVKSNFKKGIRKSPGRWKSIYNEMMYYPEYNQIENENGSEIFDDSLRKIISKCQKLLGNLNL